MRKGFYYPILPPYMDAIANHPGAKEGTVGPCVFILKCLLLGTPYDSGYKLDTIFDNGLEATIRLFQAKNNIGVDGNFGQETRHKLAQIFGVDLDNVPHSAMSVSDLALQPNGEIFLWPPSAIIVAAGDKNLRTQDGYYKLLPPYLDWPGAHSNPAGQTMGVSVFIAKCLFLGSEHYKGYPLNTLFCEGLAKTISSFQSSNGLEVDSCFGQETRKTFERIYGRNLEAIPRQVLHEQNKALQPNGSLIAWPPAIVIV